MLPDPARKPQLPSVLIKIWEPPTISHDDAAKSWHVLDLHVLWCHWPLDRSWWGGEDPSHPESLRPVVVDAGTGRSSDRGGVVVGVVLLGLRGTGRSSLRRRLLVVLLVMEVRDQTQSIVEWGKGRRTYVTALGETFLSLALAADLGLG